MHFIIVFIEMTQLKSESKFKNFIQTLLYFWLKLHSQRFKIIHCNNSNRFSILLESCSAFSAFSQTDGSQAQHQGQLGTTEFVFWSLQ